MSKNTPRPRPLAEISARIVIPNFTPTMQTVVGMGGVFNLTGLPPLQRLIGVSGWANACVVVVALLAGFLLAVAAGRRQRPWLPTAFAALAGATRWGLEQHPAQAGALVAAVILTLLGRWALTGNGAGRSN